jgi:N-acetyl-anhydromuramyl-L-alanine amidase AmpD
MILARNYHRGRIAPVRLLVLHDMETPETSRTAENVATWFAGPDAPKASAHWCIDDDSTVPCVPLTDTAWHAPGANADGIGYEQAGRARQTREEWLDSYSRAVIRRTASQMFLDARQFGIPLRLLTDAQVADGRTKGITFHGQVSRVFKRSTHTDPGPNYPFDVLLAELEQLQRGASLPAKVVTKVKTTTTVAAPKAPQIPLRATIHTSHARVWQRQMRARGWRIAVDGVYGPGSAAICRAFQKEKGLTVDGIVGPKTWAATWKAAVT